MIAYLIRTEIPGLVDVVLEDGQEFRDLTVGQLRDLAAREGWTVRPAPSTR